MDVPAALQQLPAHSALFQQPTIMMDHATAQLDTSSPPHPSDTALNVLSIAQPALLPVPALAARLTLSCSMEPAPAHQAASSTPTDSALPVSMAARPATHQLLALSATLPFFFRMPAASPDVELDTTNQDSPVLSAQLDAPPAPQPMSVSSAKPASLLTMDSAM